MGRSGRPASGGVMMPPKRWCSRAAASMSPDGPPGDPGAQRSVSSGACPTRSSSALAGALSVLSAAVATLIERQAPHVRPHVQPTSRQNVDQATDELRDVDLLVLPHGIVTGLPHRNLYQGTLLR